jgi:hypothetical protein
MGGWLFYLRSGCDDELDDYEQEYSVYRVPALKEYRFDEDPWLFSESAGLTFVGKVEVAKVEFDKRKHRELDAAVLAPLLGPKRTWDSVFAANFAFTYHGKYSRLRT